MEREVLRKHSSSNAGSSTAPEHPQAPPPRSSPAGPRGGRSRILAQIPGKYIVEAMGGLPPCSEQAEPMQVEIDAGLFGRFRVTYRAYRHPQPAWQSGWFWIADSAERLDPTVP
jgi:hypothetical protein